MTGSLNRSLMPSARSSILLSRRNEELEFDRTKKTDQISLLRSWLVLNIAGTSRSQFWCLVFRFTKYAYRNAYEQIVALKTGPTYLKAVVSVFALGFKTKNRIRSRLIATTDPQSRLKMVQFISKTPCQPSPFWLKSIVIAESGSPNRNRRTWSWDSILDQCGWPKKNLKASFPLVWFLAVKFASKIVSFICSIDFGVNPQRKMTSNTVNRGLFFNRRNTMKYDIARGIKGINRKNSFSGIMHQRDYNHLHRWSITQSDQPISFQWALTSCSLK